MIFRILRFFSGCLLFMALIPVALLSQVNSHVDSFELQLKENPSGNARLELLLKFSKDFSQTDFRKALGYALEAIAIAQHSGTPGQLAEAELIAGNASYYLGLMEESARHRTRYLEFIKETGGPKDFAIAYANLGGIWIAKGEYRKATELFLKALDYLENGAGKDAASKYLTERVGIYNNLGIVYRELGEFAKATDACARGINLAKDKPELQQDYIRLLNNYGELMLDSSRIAEARMALGEALHQSVLSANKTMQAASVYNLSKLLEKTGRNDSALLYAKKGYVLARELNQPDLLRGLAERLQEIFEKTNRLDSSLYYLKMVQEYDQVIKLNEAKEILLQQEMNSEFKQKEQALTSKYEKEQMRLWVIAGFVFLLAVILALLYFIARNKVRRTEHEKLELELLAQKFEIDQRQLRAELETRNKELASQVMMQIRRTELIEEIIRKLLGQESGDQKSIVNELKSLREDDVWKEFDTRFTQVETAFFDKLRALNPDLTNNERRLCALLRLDMSTKEIAALTHQSIRAVELARIRLRKKLGITNTEKGLSEFLSSL